MRNDETRYGEPYNWQEQKLDIDRVIIIIIIIDGDASLGEGEEGLFLGCSEALLGVSRDGVNGDGDFLFIEAIHFGEGFRSADDVSGVGVWGSGDRYELGGDNSAYIVSGEAYSVLHAVNKGVPFRGRLESGGSGIGGFLGALVDVLISLGDGGIVSVHIPPDSVVALLSIWEGGDNLLGFTLQFLSIVHGLIVREKGRRRNVHACKLTNSREAGNM